MARALAVAGAPASDRVLAGLCDRVAISLDAGVDVRRVWRSESNRSHGAAGRACATVADSIERGVSLDDAIADQAPTFPPLLVEMARVGELTGSTPEVFRRLAKHYERRVARTRDFRSAIAWPIVQLVIALVVVGAMIAIGGMIDDRRGEGVDFLGFGLVGSAGLVVYLNLLIGVALLLGVGGLALRRRPSLAAAVREQASRLPVVGGCLQQIALARIAWALHLTMNVEMDLRRLAPLALRASDNNRYTRHGDAVAASINRGEPLSVAFALTGVFPRDFLDALEVAEESGRIAETMDRLSRAYEERAEHAVATLARVAAFLIWAAVATLIILLVFRVFGFYTGAINDALEGI